jgi:hypothetical protein
MSTIGHTVNYDTFDLEKGKKGLYRQEPREIAKAAKPS